MWYAMGEPIMIGMMSPWCCYQNLNIYKQLPGRWFHGNSEKDALVAYTNIVSVVEQKHAVLSFS